jgi:hypothetical protein
VLLLNELNECLTHLVFAPVVLVVCCVCVFMQVLVSAAEAAEMILRVDDIIKCAPRERDHHH